MPTILASPATQSSSAQPSVGAGEVAGSSVAGRLDRLLASAPWGIWVIDAQGLTTQVNAAMAGMLGYEAAEMLGRPLFDFMDEEGEEIARANIARSRAGLGERQGFRFLKKDGQAAWLMVDHSRLLDEENRGAGAVGLVTDGTEEHHREVELARSRALLEVAVGQFPSPVIIVDAPDGKVRLANQAALTLGGGQTAEDSPSWPGGERTSIDQILPATAGIKEIEDLLLRALASGHTTRSAELTIAFEGKPTRHLLVDAAPVRDANGTLCAAIAVLNDVTERHAQELERERAQELATMNQRVEDLGRLAGVVAHDLNNLLAVVMGQTDLSLLLMDEDHPARAQMEKAIGAATRAANLGRQLMAFTGVGPLDQHTLDLCELLEATVEGHRARLPGWVELSFDRPPSPLHVLADAVQIQQMTGNLVQNSIEAIGARPGRVRVSVSARRLTEETSECLGSPRLIPDSACARILVEDDGEGISPEEQTRVFHPWYSTRGRGGLGLNAVLGIVRGHGGAIELQQRDPRGTRAVVWLPLQRPPQEIGPESTDRIPARILIVDDDDGVREVYMMILVHAGYRVETVNGGRAALERLSLGPANIDLVLLDMMMPDMNGDEVMAEMECQGHALPVVVCSGYAQDQVIDRFKDLHPAALLQKPLHARDLVRAVGRVLEVAPT